MSVTISTDPNLVVATAEAPAHTSLRFQDISMVFPDGTAALGDVSFTVNRGEFVTVVGPSGCGKSTLLRIASGLTAPSSGVVDVQRSSLGYVFQDPTLLPWRTVEANVALIAQLRKVDKATRSVLVRDALELVGLTGHERKRPKQLSGGMRMRVSLARSLILHPEVFLFDEPFGALDEMSRERLNAELLRLFQIERFAGLFITHSIAEAVFLSTRVLVMSPRPGRIVADIKVDFPFPRSHELRFEPKFAEMCGVVSAALRH